MGLVKNLKSYYKEDQDPTIKTYMVDLILMFLLELEHFDRTVLEKRCRRLMRHGFNLLYIQRDDIDESIIKIFSHLFSAFRVAELKIQVLEKVRSLDPGSEIVMWYKAFSVGNLFI